MVVVEAKEAEKLPVMMLHAEKPVGNVEKLSRLLLALKIAGVHLAEKSLWSTSSARPAIRCAARW